ncbi:DNA-directed RNA polymerase I subunit RPA2, partial [Tachysurus ichikawai]
MDHTQKWSVLPTAPSLKHLTEAGFGLPKEKQQEAVQDLVKAHIESFDQAVTDGLCRVVQ